jgi:putative transposase
LRKTLPGTSPSAANDQRTASAYIFGAICPGAEKAPGLSCNNEAMALNLEEISLVVAPSAHALVLLDQVGWHASKKLPVPGNITVVPLPPKSPELNPVGKYLAVHARQLALEPRLSILRRHP